MTNLETITREELSAIDGGGSFILNFCPILFGTGVIEPSPDQKKQICNVLGY